MLEDFFKEEPLRSIRKDLTGQINKLIEGIRSAQIPVIWVRQGFREDLEDAFLSMKMKNIKITIAGTFGSKILSEFKVESNDHEIVKKRYSAFYETQLDSLLKKLEINELVLSGINSHACVRTAAIDAFQRDMEVTVIKDCVASYDEEHHEITLKYLNHGIARVVDLELALSEMAL